MIQFNKNSNLKLIVKIVCAIIIMAVCFVLGNIATKYGIVIGNDKDKNILANAREYSEFDKLYEARKKIDALYDGDIDSEKLAVGAVKGMVDALEDPYSLYMTNDEFKKYMESSSGEFMGIGVHVNKTDKGVVIYDLISGGGAEEAGIKPGDIIKTVEGEAIGTDLEKAVSLMTGDEEKTLKIVVTRDGKDIELQVKRRKVVEESAQSEMVENNIGYLTLKNFDSHSSEQFIKNLNSLKDSGMKGLIIDLRGNGGGYVTEAVKIASQFIPKGKTVTYTLDKYDNKKVYESIGTDILEIPMVVLIDNGTASASEILTGALKDYNLITTVGVTSYGKGIVQLPFELPSGNGALKLTVSKYYSPNGENIHKKGIEPDYKVEIPKEVLDKAYSKDIDTQYQKALEVIKEKVGE